MAQGAATKVKKRKKSVLKRAQQSRERAEVNSANRTRVRTMMRRLRTAIIAGDSTAVGNLLHPTMAAIDRAITKGVLHENTGNRYKSRLSLAYNGLKAKAAKENNWVFMVSPKSQPRPASSFFCSPPHSPMAGHPTLTSASRLRNKSLLVWRFGS